ncbi:MAG: hypothetical protein HY901_12865, partial [Deltaproteobacteria bacterium]|nr:hypothetical protein [Deltaproteobacteria bacterium]
MALGFIAPRPGMVGLLQSLACFALLTVGCGGVADDQLPAQPRPRDAGVKTVSDAGQPLPPPRDGGSGNCAVTGCPTGRVCCESAGCAGQCVPDCRDPENVCPEQAPLCDQASGMCRPARPADG